MPDAVRLVLHDAAGYDPATGKGGVDGSVVLYEMDRPENKGLKPFVARLAKVKAAIDAQKRPGEGGGHGKGLGRRWR